MMVPTESTFSLKGIGMLLRFVAVGFSSVAAILSTTLPLFFYGTLSSTSIMSVASILLIGTMLIHGLLTHTFNDLTDYQSGTDQISPGILSGGSRVIQTGTMTVRMLIQLGFGSTLLLLLFTTLFILFGYAKYALLTIVGIWGAGSYSLKPLRLSYYPFVGEWFSLFPTMLILGIAAPWILLNHVPLWAWQNALVNAIWCMAWVMVHHIPDRHADRQALPMKRTSVVWAEDRFGKKASILPAFLYFSFVCTFIIWIALTRPLAAIGAGVICVFALLLLITMDSDDVDNITQVEKSLLLFAFVTAIWLGVFV